jgi:hypothetical protein
MNSNPCFLAGMALAMQCSAALAQAPACPSSCITLDYGCGFGAPPQNICSSLPNRDTTGISSRGAYDLRTGHTLALVRQYTTYCASVTTDDVYTIHGVPSGTPVTFQARLVIQGSNQSACTPHGNCASGSSTVTLRESPGLSTSQLVSCRPSCTQTIALTLTHSAGETFHLQTVIDAETGGYNDFQQKATARAETQLQFIGLPPGVYVTSCQGYYWDITPVRRTSWGGLKTIYR